MEGKKKVNIHYTRTGGNKPPLILLHGLMTGGACWRDVANALSDQYDLIMPDARGHGLSDAPLSGYSYEDHADDVVNLIHTLGIPAPFLLGHSMGGMTAAVVASRKPNILKGLILADPTFLSVQVQQEVYNSDVAEQHRKILQQPIEHVIADARARHPHRSAENIELFSRARLQTSISAFEVLTPPNPDYRELMKKIDIPSLLLFGDKGVVNPSIAGEFDNPLLQTAQIPGAGHTLHMDQPEQFIKRVKKFLYKM